MCKAEVLRKKRIREWKTEREIISNFHCFIPQMASITEYRLG